MPIRRRLVRGAILGLSFFLAGMLATRLSLVRLGRIEAPAVLILGEPSDTLVLVAPLDSSIVRLINHDGTVVHQWQLDRETTGTVELLSDGSLMFFAKAREGEVPKTPMGAAGVGLRRVSWDGDELWTYDDYEAHHDFAVLPDGTVAVIGSKEMSEEQTTLVQGGVPDTEVEGRMRAAQIVEVDPEIGESRLAFDAAQQLDPVVDALPEWMSRAEWTHANSLAYTESDPINGEEAYLISFRTISTIAIVSRATGKIIWKYGGKWVLDQQHDASYLPNGNILVFDNGQYLRMQPSTSQVIEIDPRTNEIVWTYPERRDALTTPYSSIISGAQRLPNDNTLITYGVSGRLLEVTRDGDVVWDAMPAPGHSIFKARAYPTSLITQFQTTPGS